MRSKNFTAFKNTFYILYMCVTAFFLMNDFKVTTLIMMAVIAPTILLMEHYESMHKSPGESE